MQSPIYLRGQARPSWRESAPMHAIGRIALHGEIGNVQVLSCIALPNNFN
jgi:FO synthase